MGFLANIIHNPPYLTWIIFLPLLGALLLYCVPGFGPTRDRDGHSVRGFSLLITLVTFALSCLMLMRFEGASASYQFSVMASHSIDKKVRGYLACMLVLETAMLGTLLALDVFLFYVFWELMLAPMYFIIGVWGGKRKIYATLKFVLYTVTGSLLMLIAIFYVVWSYSQQHAGAVSFLLSDLVSGTQLTLREEIWLFSAFALAFGIKIPLFPFHTWLPDAHVEAPTGGSVVLAGVLLKMGLYGFIRFAYPLFPRAAELFTPYLAGLAVIGIVYGALVAWAQKDIKKLVAYSSVSHLGYCVLGFAAFNLISTTGSIYQMLNHGVSTGALFLLVGVLYDRRHTREIKEYGGLASQVPVFAFLFLVFTLSSIALPLTNGFIGEFLILTGSFPALPTLTIIALIGVVLGAVYMLTLYMKTMFGEIDTAKNGNLTDVSRIELMTFIPLLIMVFWMGLFPQPFLDRMQPSIKSYLEGVNQRKVALQDSERQSGADSEPQKAEFNMHAQLDPAAFTVRSGEEL